jgi:uncharacterized delta-60 repeat protein
MRASNPRAASAVTRATKSVIEQLEERRLMSAGSPDSTFGSNGVTLSDFAGAIDDGRSIAVQSNGDIIVLASKGGASHLLRYDADTGARDTSFDVTVDVSQARAIALQDDDSILVVGTASSSIGTNGTSDLAVERFSANGVLDSAFGVKQVDFTDPISGASGDELGWAVTTSGDNIIVAGTTNFGGFNYAAVAKISASNPSTTPVTAEIDLDSPGVNVFGVAVQANGGIVVAGSDSSELNFAVERFAPDLTVDHNFGDDSSGVKTLPMGNAVSIATDGDDILIDGHSFGFNQFGDPIDFATVIKLSGAIDAHGAQLWRTDLNFGDFSADAQGIAVQSDHKVVVGGAMSGFGSVGFIARLNANGSMDTDFGSNGISQLTTPDGYTDTGIESVAIQSNGKILGTGAANNSETFVADVLVTRVDGDDVVTPPANTAPTSSNGSTSVNEDGSVLIDLTAQANDAESPSASLTYSILTGPSHGSLTDNHDGTFTYHPAGDYNGSDSFTFKANDGELDSAPATFSITVNPVNDAPVASNTSASTNAGTAVTINLAPLASDVDHDGLTFSTGAAAHGTIVNNNDGTVTYTPSAGYSGSDSFTFKAFDGTAYSNVATVSLTVVPTNHNPVANADAKKADENVTLTFAASDLLANDTDADGDVLTLTGVSASSANGGTVTFSSGQITYTAATDFYGSDTFTYSISDGHGGTATGTVTVTVLTPEQAIDDIIAQVDELHDDGLLNGGNTNALMTKLDGAAAKLSKDQYNAAINKIQSFINQVSDWMSSGKLTSTIGQSLIASANDVIASIQAEMA